MNLLAVNWTIFGIVIGIVAVLAIVFAVLIVTVSKLCAVKEDERIPAVSEKLAGANCGGCGFAGCADYAKALVEGRAEMNACNATSNESKAEIAKILDIPFVAGAAQFAVVKCAGGKNAIDRFEYVGEYGCKYEYNSLGGRKVCSYACLGGGSCADICQYGAIKVVDQVAVVDKALCEACGVCVKNCSKKVIDLVPKTATVYVACSSHCKGKDVMGACSVGCIGCGLCAKVCPNGAISMVDNLPVIDYSKCNGCKTCVSKCPRKTIKEL